MAQSRNVRKTVSESSNLSAVAVQLDQIADHSSVQFSNITQMKFHYKQGRQAADFLEQQGVIILGVGSEG